jgi:hypothetical protein
VHGYGLYILFVYDMVFIDFVCRDDGSTFILFEYIFWFIIIGPGGPKNVSISVSDLLV